MALSLVLLKQILIMFLLMGMGYLLFRTGKISLAGNKELGSLLISVILPASIIRSFLTDYSTEKWIAFLWSLAAALAALLLAIVVSRISFGSHARLEHFSAAFSNAGFIGIPLVKSAIGEDAVFYVASFVALLNILQWTYGVFIMSGNREAISFKKIRSNPVVISLAIGILLFLTQLPVPGIATDVLSLVSSMTAPVAMITLGVYLAQIPFRELFREKWSYLSSLIRLLVIPILTIGLLTILPIGNNAIRYAVLIASAAPVGSNVAIFAQLYHQDYSRAVKSVCVSTLCSIVTMPLVMAAAQLFWK